MERRTGTDRLRRLLSLALALALALTLGAPALAAKAANAVATEEADVSYVRKSWVDGKIAEETLTARACKPLNGNQHRWLSDEWKRKTSSKAGNKTARRSRPRSKTARSCGTCRKAP